MKPNTRIRLIVLAGIIFLVLLVLKPVPRPKAYPQRLQTVNHIARTFPPVMLITTNLGSTEHQPK